MNSLKFGTSGLRGLAVELEGQAARRYAAAFFAHLSRTGAIGSGAVYLARDFRPSSAAILRDCAMAAEAAGLVPVDCGALPTPALALHAMAASCPAIMVTGSHIPADRNGLKFYRPDGEISKADEAGILAALSAAAIDTREVRLRDEHGQAEERYIARFAHLLPRGALAGLRIGLFEHSTVARDILRRALGHFGAVVVPLGRTETFVPVDTEAFADTVFAPLRGWLAEHRLDAIVSSDGDGDRPLLMDGSGDFVRGDVLGLLTARYLGACSVVTPVTSNSAIERTGLFAEVIRTRVGSPYVVAELDQATGPAVGFEANGGTLVGRGVSANGAVLAPLETRDAVLPLLAVLGLAAREGVPVARLVAGLPLQQALADRLQDVPSAKSGVFLKRLVDEPGYAETLFGEQGIASVSQIDGVQFRTDSGDMVHFRASGNAPELRCYVEGSTAEVAAELLAWGMAVAAREVR
ncbi:MAG: hypothetical protein ABS75_20705 [Pelagibacterium sp. SCN 63-23]|nr:MAG: hypothetical protein ABS75_20705 [Pelagibacterium sp. SCN 63-23]